MELTQDTETRGEGKGGMMDRVRVIISSNRPLPLPLPFSSVETLTRRPSAVFYCQFQNQQKEVEKGRFKWMEVRPIATPRQKEAISKLPFKMTNRCKALLRQIIVRHDPSLPLPSNSDDLHSLLTEWAELMKPDRCDWLDVIKQLSFMNHPLHLPVFEFALLEESFETNIRDYTKLMHFYGKEGRLRDAETLLCTMKDRGFELDQVVLTALVDMYGKAGNLELVEEVFGQIRLLGVPIDKRSYGAMIMAYIRAGMPERGEALIGEMDEHEVRGGSEIYKALLRAYSYAADSDGAQRVFDALQLAGVIPDARLCGLLVNAYAASGQIEKAFAVLENMKKVGIKPNDKCVAVILEAHEREHRIIDALNFLLKLEKDGVVMGKEASGILARWLKELGVVEQVKSVLKDYEVREPTVVECALPIWTGDRFSNEKGIKYGKKYFARNVIKRRGKNKT